MGEVSEEGPNDPQHRLDQETTALDAVIEKLKAAQAQDAAWERRSTAFQVALAFADLVLPREDGESCLQRSRGDWRGCLRGLLAHVVCIGGGTLVGYLWGAVGGRIYTAHASWRRSARWIFCRVLRVSRGGPCSSEGGMPIRP